MTTDFIRLTFMWLLPLTAAVASGQNHSFTDVKTGEVTGDKFTHDQLTTQETSSLNPLSQDSGLDVPSSTKGYVYLTEEKTSTKPSWQTSKPTPPETFNKTAATPTNSLSSSTGMKSTTEAQSQVTKSTTMVVTSQASNLPKATGVSPMGSSSTQSQGTGKTPASQFPGDKITYTSTRPPQSTNLIPTATKSTEPEEDKSESTSPLTDGDATQDRRLYKTSVATPFILITKAKDRQGPSGKKTDSNKGTNHSKVVAGLIGGALVLMMVGFLAIYINKRKLQKQQITTTDWAGPSPFLEGGAGNGQVTVRSSNRISLASFLPQRLSKRLSLLPETDEELQDMTPGTTFGGKHQGSTSVEGMEGNDAGESNGSAAVVPGMKSSGDVTDTVEDSVSATPLETKDPLCTNNNPEVANLSQDQSANLSNLSGAVENAPAEQN